MKTIVVIGGTGAQGASIVRHLASTNDYNILTLTRNTTSPRAEALARLPHVTLIAMNTAHGYDLEAFSKAAAQSDCAFINTDGFAVGEQAETYWGIRLFELARRAGVKHFVYSGLDYIGAKSGYDPKLYVGHYEGKARVQEFMRAQPTSPMAWSIVSSGPYIEALHEIFLPTRDADGVLLFTFPLGQGAIPFIHLSDFARYVAWILSHPEESNGMNLEIATAHVPGAEVAAAFTAVTGRPAKYIDVPIDVWHEKAWAKLPKGPKTKIGYRDVDDRLLLQTYQENFTAWWELYKASGGNSGLIKRDYALLDRILPDRIKTVEEWMRKVEYDGQRRSVLKSQDEYS